MTPKNDQTLILFGGLPRSGSTVLGEILAQNPQVYVSPTSGLLATVDLLWRQWDSISQHTVVPHEENRRNVLQATIASYHQHQSAPYVIDKSRCWANRLELLNDLLGYKVKLIAPVRDVRQILASFEQLWRTESRIRCIKQEQQAGVSFQTLEGRMAYWMSPAEAVGKAHNSLVDACRRGLQDQILFVDYERLLADPQGALDTIYRFLDLEACTHDFATITDRFTEDSLVYGIRDLHTIRPALSPSQTKWEELLGPAAEQYAEHNFWLHSQLNLHTI